MLDGLLVKLGAPMDERKAAESQRNRIQLCDDGTEHRQIRHPNRAVGRRTWGSQSYGNTESRERESLDRRVAKKPFGSQGQPRAVT